MKCTGKEWDTCRVEKMGCAGCYYTDMKEMKYCKDRKMFRVIILYFKLRNDKMLTLPIKKKWFEMIVNGEKKEEYREFKEYYHIRFKRMFGLDYKNKSAEIIFRNGYSYNSPSVRCLCTLEVGQGKKEWGAKPNEKYYKLIILRILEVGNYEIPIE